MRLLAAAALFCLLLAPASAGASQNDGGLLLASKPRKDHPERTQQVHGYTKKNGTKVAPYKRAPAGKGTKKKKKS